MRKKRLMQEPRCNLQGNGRPHHDVVVKSVVSESGLDKLQEFQKKLEAIHPVVGEGSHQPQPHMEIASASKY
jgi:hypothetical protein